MSSVQNISLYVPYVVLFTYDDKIQIERLFSQFGKLSHIDYILKRDKRDNEYYTVYVHYDEWYNDDKTIAFYNSIVYGNNGARLYYDNKYYWNVFMNKSKKYISGNRRVRINLDDMTVVNIASTLSPVASNIEKSCPGAPMKRSYAEAMSRQNERNEESESNEYIDCGSLLYDEETNAQMDEIEELLEQDDINLVSIDGRYVKTIEFENFQLRNEVEELKRRLQAEINKKLTQAENQALLREYMEKDKMYKLKERENQLNEEFAKINSSVEPIVGECNWSNGILGFK